MYEGDNNNDRPTLPETYALAVNASSLKVEKHRRGGHAVVLAAAGMSSHRQGMALRRLRSEWDSRAKPQPASPELLQAMAGTYERLDSGLVRIAVQVGGAQEHRDVTPIQAAKAEADNWHAHELLLLFQGLKTLPSARAGLVHWAWAKGIDDAEHVVGAVLRWWLDPNCPACHGLGLRVVPGTGRTGKRKCGECHGKRELKVPRGRDGLRVLRYMGECLRGSAKDMRESLSKMIREKDKNKGAARPNESQPAA